MAENLREEEGAVKKTNLQSRTSCSCRPLNFELLKDKSVMKYAVQRTVIIVF
ncbi:hypothetical protein [Cylindrospermopsis raciborskii]|uniref:hypothetical protein n=1 Tax=Cylindrospermopsis raciborskii TaxID=77022 RepID=UPI0022BDF60C|nr:hypothetical protein [Cylindrospermopsis raciborskii]MCZ2207890.1 hypothetical protein [Cylindrospermopsis raciborskii PAMP2011]